MKGALASNWVVEACESVSGGFKLLGSDKGYTTFAKAFKNGDKVFYAVHDENGNREAGWATANGTSITDRNPTATLVNNIYTEGDNLPPVAFNGRVTIACTFNAVAFDTIWDHVFREDNPHNVTAPQVDLEPVLLPLGPDDQNVQAALEWLYSYFTEHGGGDWHLTHIDGNYVYIEIKHGPRSEFPPTIVDLDLAELKINHDDGELWTRLADDTIVKIGDKDLITEAPIDGELYGRKDGEWHRISLATVSDNMPKNPQEGDLWVDTKNTLELYVYIHSNGWVSMTGAGSGGGGLADNIVLDDMDGTLVNTLLGREMLEDGSARWRPIYTSDVIPADGASPMTRTDGSELRTQADINKFLYELMGDGDWVPVSGGVFEGPIFGPSVPPICDTRHPVWSDFPSDVNDNILDDLTIDPRKLIVQTKMPGYVLLGDDIQNRFKIRPPSQYQLNQWADGKDATLLFVEDRGDGKLHMQVHEVEGGILYHRHPDGYGVLYGESKTCRGSVMAGGFPCYVYKVGEDISPYVTVELLRKIGESGEIYVPAQGGEFTGPIFGPSVDNLNSDNPSVLKVDPNPHADPTCPEGEVIVQTLYAYDRPVNGAEQRLKLHIADGADKYCGQPDIEYALVQANGRVQILVCEDSGFSSDSGTVLNVESQTCYGDDLQAGVATQVWRTSVDASPYVTLEMFKKLALNISVTAHAHVGPNPPLSMKDGALWFDTNPDVMTLFVWHEDAKEWEPCKPDGGPSLGDLLWEEIDTGSNQSPPITLQITHPARPTQNASEGLFYLWHGDPALEGVNGPPEQEFKVWMSDGGKAIQDKYDEDGFAPEFELRQGDKRLRFKALNGGWTTAGQTYHASCHETEGDVLTDGPCEWFIKYEDSSLLEPLDERYDERYVKKAGGDFMEGPLDIRKQDGTGSRDTNKVKTLGVYSGSDDALRLGTNDQTDRVYVGKNDTSFNGPIKVGEIVERHDGQGTTVTNELHVNDTIRFGRDHSLLMEINPESGTTQDILMFNGQPNGKNLKLDIRGATFNNAIKIESGPSSDREIVAHIDSNKGIKFKNLSAWDTKIRDVSDPTNDKDAVNLRYLEDRITDRLSKFITENSAGAMKFQLAQFPQGSGRFNTWTANGASSTPDPAQVREIWAHKFNMSGYQFNWGDVKPNTYLYMSGPGGLLMRFRVVADPVEVPENNYWKIKVADGECEDDSYRFSDNDEWDVIFRSVSGGTADLDDYLPIDGSKAMTGSLQAYEKVTAKIPDDGSEFGTAVLMAEGWRTGAGNSGARLTLSNKYDNNAYATIEHYGTSFATNNVQFDRAKFEFKRFGDNREGFVVRGRADNGSGVGNNAKLLSVYHNSGSNHDAVNYYGKQSDATNVATVGYIDNVREELLKAIEDKQNQTKLFSTPFCMVNQDNYLYYTSNSSTMPPENKIYGMYSDGNSLTTNEWLGNWNHSLRIGENVICIQQDGSKLDLPVNYDQEWTGTVSIFQIAQDTSFGTVKLDLCYKNTVGRIRKQSNGIIYVYTTNQISNSGRHLPIFSRDSTRKELVDAQVVIMLDVYRMGELGEPPAGGNVTYEVADDE
jgi:hypothetical protein